MVWGAPRGVDDIVTRLRANDIGLKSLYLMRNRRFEEADAVALCDALQSNTVLIDLNISSHAVTPAMASAFAAALAANSTLKSLALGNASFGDEVRGGMVYTGVIVVVVMRLMTRSSTAFEVY